MNVTRLFSLAVGISGFTFALGRRLPLLTSLQLHGSMCGLVAPESRSVLQEETIEKCQVGRALFADCSKDTEVSFLISPQQPLQTDFDYPQSSSRGRSRKDGGLSCPATIRSGIDGMLIHPSDSAR